MEEVDPPKRGRGRPPGSLNKKTLARQAELARAEETPDEFVLDVEFDEGQQPVPEELPEPSEELPEPPSLSRQRSVRMTAPQSREALGRVSESPVSAPTILSPRPAKRQRPKPVAKPVAKTVAKPVEPAPPPNYLEVLKQGLAIAKASHKAEKVARYDNFFRM